MNSYLLTLLSGTSQGLFWAVMALGGYLTYRLLDFADLTVEGSFPLGAAVSVVLIGGGMNPWLSILIAALSGALAGFVTGFFNTVCKIPPILSGILTMIALYSVNLRVMGGRATVAFERSVKSDILKVFSFGNQNLSATAAGLILCAALVGVLYLFFGTEIGCAIRATGQNAAMARAMGVHTGRMTVLTLMLSNALVAASGALIGQIDYGSALATMGQGTIVISLASIIIGEVIFGKRDRNFALKLTAVVIGAVIYRCIFAFALRVEFLKATDLKLITAVIIAFALTLPNIKAKRRKNVNNRLKGV